MIIAWDIETCPLPLASLGEVQQRRYRKQLDRLGADGVSADEEVSRRVRSLHPALCWICCIAVVRSNPDGSPRPAVPYTAAGPDEEGDLLRRFWDDVARLGRRSVTWVTFNGKGFDAEVLRTRSLVWGLVPPRTDLLDDYPYRFTPHCDLMNLWRRSAVSFEDVCALLGIESPKQGLNGSGVCAAVEAGDLEAVARYCEADALAVYRCYERVAPQLGHTLPRRVHGQAERAAQRAIA